MDGRDPRALPALFSAKAEAAVSAVEVANEAMTLMGGVAYRDSARIQRLLRDARAAHVMSPTTDMLRTWTGRALLGQALLGE
jgi:alkylation response protein AidB-like acyl-CoA dehydrogenase